MRQSSKTLTAQWAPAFLLLLALAGCGQQEPREALLLNSINSMEEAARNKDPGTLMEFVDQDYQDSQGRNWNDLKRIAQFEFLRNRNVHLYKLVRETSFDDDDTANAVILVAMAGQPIDNVEQLVALRADLLRFDVTFHFDGQWRVTTANWLPARRADFLP